MAEYYPVDTLAHSRTLYERIKAWAAARGDVTIIGGWPVHELVAQDYKMQSRDTDLVLHTRASLDDLLVQLPKWGLELRRSGRSVFPDCTFKGHTDIVVDILTTGAFDATELFGRSPVLTKQVDLGLMPTVQWLVADKITTIPERIRDAIDKRTKDFLDLYALVFHNTQRIHPLDLLSASPGPARKKAATHLAASKEWQPKYASDLDAIGEWLRTPGKRG